MHGEVHNPLLPDLLICKNVQPPYETLPEICRPATRSTASAPRPINLLSVAPARARERYQFIRGSFNTYLDIAEVDVNFDSLLQRDPGLLLEELEFWCSTDVDAVNFMDDWGAQRKMLISPHMWREIFKPLYREYCEMAHAHGKFIFMQFGWLYPRYLSGFDPTWRGRRQLAVVLYGYAPDRRTRRRAKSPFGGKLTDNTSCPKLRKKAGRPSARSYTICIDPRGRRYRVNGVRPRRQSRNGHGCLRRMVMTGRLASGSGGPYNGDRNEFAQP